MPLTPYPMQSSIVFFDPHFLSWQVEEGTTILPRTLLFHLRFRRIKNPQTNGIPRH